MTMTANEVAARHPARDQALNETAARLAQIAVWENDEVVIANCIGTLEAAIGMIKERTSAQATAAFLLSAAEAVMDHAEHAQAGRA
jgi:hypothetical protein